jgi:hypothetical protein
MKTIRIVLIIYIVLTATDFFGQQVITVVAGTKCDSLIKYKKSVKIGFGDIQCINDPGKDQIIYFTKKEEFKNYMHKNKNSKGLCLDKQEMTFDFDKFNVILIRVSIAGCGLPKYDLKVLDSKNNHKIYLTFYQQKIICAEKNILSRYILLPKGKLENPEFNICK